LKRHLLPQILSILRNERASHSADHSRGESHGDNLPLDGEGDINSIYLKNDRMFEHSLLRINYTTYDVRRSQDVVNTMTSHCNVMVLANHTDNSIRVSHHRFKYARVLGIYHANVIYIGAGMVDYDPRRVEFLWVRWYEHLDAIPSGWDARRLDRIRFPSVNDEESFGFLNPSDVLRGCHVIPAFMKGLSHGDGKGLSFYARDSSDWAGYYVDRYVCLYSAIYYF
jgi:hypothetical protein